MKSVYILSTGRTGTKFIEKFLSDNLPSSNVTHERRGSRFLNIIGNIAYAGFIPKKSIPLFVKLSTYRKKDNVKWDIDSNNMLWFSLAHSSLLKEGDVVIHIVRDPRTYIFSHLSIARFRPKSFVANYLLPFWQPNPALSRQVRLKEYLFMNKLEKYAWVWRIKNEYISSLYKHRSNYFFLRFEDLFDMNKSKEITELFNNIFGMNFKDINDKIGKKENISVKSIDIKYLPLIESHCKHICKDLMKVYNYF